MTDLVEFIEARLAEDERLARAAGWHRWDLGVVYGTIMAVSNGKPVARDAREYDAEHIARHDPARVLREVEAKRRLLGEHNPIDPCDAHDASFRTVPCPTLELLALPYADHPDYRSEWAS